MQRGHRVYQSLSDIEGDLFDASPSGAEQAASQHSNPWKPRWPLADVTAFDVRQHGVDFSCRELVTCRSADDFELLADIAYLLLSACQSQRLPDPLCNRQVARAR